MEKTPLERQDGLIAGGLSLGLAAVYWILRCRTFGPGDSPQHVLSAVTWGVSVAPGYPLYVLLGKLMSLLPLGTPAASVNGLSGLLHAAAVGVFFLVLRRQGAGRLPAAIASALLAFSRLFWYYSEIAEVRALNDLLAIAAVYFSLLFIDTKRTAHFLLLAAVLGLGIGHHPTYVLILPPLAYLLLKNNTHAYNRAALGAATASAFLACAAPYVILWLRLQHGPAPVWNPAETKSLAGVWALFTRKSVGGPFRMVVGSGVFGFGTFSAQRFFQHMAWFLTACWTDLNPAGLVLAAAGIIALARKDRATAIFWGLWVVVTAFVFIGISSQQLILCDAQYVRGMVARFYLLPYLGLFAFAGFGAHWLLSKIRPVFGWALLAAAVVVPAALRPMNLSHHDLLMDYCRLIVAGTGPKDMIILAPDDTILGMSYLELAERSTGDRVLFIPSLFSYPPYIRRLQKQHPDLVLPPIENRALSTDWREWLKRNPGRRLFAEAVLRDTILERLPQSSPVGVLGEVRLAAADRKAVAAEARKFLDATPDEFITRWGVMDFTQEVYLTRTYKMELEWYGSRLGGAEMDAGLRLRARLDSL